MSKIPNCPECNSEYVYEDGTSYTCPECGHEFPQEAVASDESNEVIKDANGTVLQDGDTVTI